MTRDALNKSLERAHLFGGNQYEGTIIGITAAFSKVIDNVLLAGPLSAVVQQSQVREERTESLNTSWQGVNIESTVFS